MERTVDWVLFIGIFIIFPVLAYQIYSTFPHIDWFLILSISFVGSGLISAIFVTPIIAIVGGILGFFSQD